MGRAVSNDRQMRTCYLPEVATGGRRDDAALTRGARALAVGPPRARAGGAGRRERPAAYQGADARAGRQGERDGSGRPRPLGSRPRGAAPAPRAHVPRLRPVSAGDGAERRGGSGVPAPAPAIVVSDTSYVGSPFLVMPRVLGDVPGPAPLFDPYVRDAGPALRARDARRSHRHAGGRARRALAGHAVGATPAGHGARGCGRPLGGLRGLVVGGRAPARAGRGTRVVCPPSTARAIDRRAVGGRAPGQPRLRRPAAGAGGARLGPGRARATGDGPRLASRARVHDGGAVRCGGVPGFPATLDVVERYQRRSGHEVHDLAWHEVFALVRALAINDRHQRITGDPRRLDNPMGDILLARLEAASRSEENR